MRKSDRVNRKSAGVGRSVKFIAILFIVVYNPKQLNLLQAKRRSMKKIVVVFLLLCSVLLANSEYNIFVSAFGDDVTQESIERERADIERKVAKIDGVKAVVSGRFGRYRSIAVKTRAMNKNDIKVLTQKIKAAGFKEAYALVAKEDEAQTGIVEKKSSEERPPTKPRSKLRKDLKFKEAPEPMG